MTDLVSGNYRNIGEAAFYGSLEEVSSYIKVGRLEGINDQFFDPNVDTYISTALHRLVHTNEKGKNNNLEIARKLLQAGADPKVESELDENISAPEDPMTRAIKSSDLEMVVLLASFGANIDIGKNVVARLTDLAKKSVEQNCDVESKDTLPNGKTVTTVKRYVQADLDNLNILGKFFESIDKSKADPKSLSISNVGDVAKKKALFEVVMEKKDAGGSFVDKVAADKEKKNLFHDKPSDLSAREKYFDEKMEQATIDVLGKEKGR